MRRYTRQMTNALLAGALVMGTGAAIANDPERLYQDETAGAAGELAAEDLSDDKIHRFIDAAHEIVSLRDAYAREMRKVEPAERPRLQAEARERIAQAIEANGLEIAEYREIGNLLENDEGLLDRLDAATGMA